MRKKPDISMFRSGDLHNASVHDTDCITPPEFARLFPDDSLRRAFVGAVLRNSIKVPSDSVPLVRGTIAELNFKVM